MLSPKTVNVLGLAPCSKINQKKTIPQQNPNKTIDLLVFCVILIPEGHIKHIKIIKHIKWLQRGTKMTFEKPDHSSSRLLYLQIADIIENRIINNELKTGDRIQPERELCKSFGVSIDTIKQAMAHLEKDGYILRRRSLGTTVISAGKKAGSSFKDRKLVCFVICTGASRQTEGSATFHELIDGVAEAAKEKKLQLLYKPAGTDKTELDFEGKEKDIAGLIVGGNITPQHIQVIRKTQIPFVLIGDVFQKERTLEYADVISTDDFQGTYTAARHLLSLGHKKIAYLSPHFNNYPWEQDHFNGYRQAMKDSGLGWDSRLEIETCSNEIGKAQIAIKELLNSRVPFTGMICSISSNLYFGVMKALNEYKIRVPDDVSIVAPEKMPGATYISIDPYAVGTAALERLTDRIQNPGWKPKRVVIPYTLNISDSTREPAGSGAGEKMNETAKS